MGKQPILVTGMHRSGTTWVGRMLTTSREAVYLHEPLNPVCAPAMLHLEVLRQYEYVDDSYAPAFERLLRFPLDSRKLERSTWQRARRIVRLLHARATGARALLKDPFAFFSIPWFVQRFGAQVVVVVRHPLSVAGSAKAMGWGFDTRWLLDQPELMRERLEPFRADLEAQPDTLAAQSALLWRIVYTVARELPGVQIVRHEDLCRDPERFEELYESLGLTFTRRVRRALRRTDAGTLESWRDRLTLDEADFVGRETADLAASYYPER